MTNIFRIPVSKPSLTELEKTYLNQAYDSHFLSRGYWVERFEATLAEYLGVKHILGVNSGTSACHLSVLTSGVQVYQNIYVPNLTYISTPNSVKYCQIGIILGEVNEDSWNLDVKFFLEKKLYNKIAAIYLVDLLGNPCNIEQWHKIAKQYNLVLIHDACESLGAEVDYAGKKYKCGSLFVRSAAFSFYMNKTIVGAGEGGAFATNNDDVYEHAKLLHGQYQHPKRRYYHEEVGMNMRMNNLSGAILTGQLERIEEILTEKRRIYNTYEKFFKNTHIKTQSIDRDSIHSCWIIGVYLKNRANVEYELNEAGIDSRRMFTPISYNPPYLINYEFPISNNIGDNVLLLPSYCDLSNKEINEICEIVIKNDK